MSTHLLPRHQRSPSLAIRTVVDDMLEKQGGDDPTETPEQARVIEELNAGYRTRKGGEVEEVAKKMTKAHAEVARRILASAGGVIFYHGGVWTTLATTNEWWTTVACVRAMQDARWLEYASTPGQFNTPRRLTQVGKDALTAWQAKHPEPRTP